MKTKGSATRNKTSPNTAGKKEKKKFKHHQTETQDVMSRNETIESIENMKKMNNFLLKNQIRKMYHTHFAGYREKDSILKEQWENKELYEKEADLEFITYRSSPELIVSLFTTISFTFTIWLANVEFFVGLNNQSFIPSYIYLAPMCALLFDFTITGELARIIKPPIATSLLKLTKPGLCIIYFILKVSKVSISSHSSWLLVQLPCLYVLYSRASKLYKSFRVMSLSKSYEYHFKAFDLIFSLIMVAHIIAIVLFLVSNNSGQEETWIKSIEIEDKGVIIKYIYSFYFSCTTILTVGYGDISPKNHIEVLVVCLVEIFGIAIFGYLLSEIGYNLGIMRKDREVIEKDLAVLQKCRDYYRVDLQLTQKARQKILTEKDSADRLKPQAEKELMMKFSEPLRQDFINANALSILKSSIFFICRWSKKFQNCLAQSLQSALYTPGEQFIQQQGEERIYVVRIGKVDFYLKKDSSQQNDRKVIHSLKNDMKTDVSNNSFGYTAVIGSKPTNIEAISTDFTSAYYIKKDDFLSIAKENPHDFEYFSEIKDKIQQSRFPESLQIPVLSSRKFHYDPSRTYLIKRQKVRNQLLKNKRQQCQRTTRKSSKLEIARLLANMITKEISEMKKLIHKSNDEIVSCRQELDHFESDYEDSDEDNNQENLSKQKIKLLLEKKNNKIMLQASSSSLQMICFETGKNYWNYYPLQNSDRILDKIQNHIFGQGKSEYFYEKEVIKAHSQIRHKKQ